MTLEILIEFMVPHGYYEWCDYIYCLINANCIEDAEDTAQAEFGMSLKEKRVSTFYPNFDNPGAEVFIEHLNSD